MFLTTLFFIRAVFSQTTESTDNLFFDPSPVDITVRDGESALFHCDTNSNDDIILYWQTENGKKIKNTSRYFIKGRGNLFFKRVDRHGWPDKTSFICICYHESGQIRSSVVRLDIQWIADDADVQLIHPKQESAIRRGTNVLLNCSAEGNPKPDVTWIKNGKRILSNGTSLQLTGVSGAQNGVYSCSASNKVGNVEALAVFILNVKDEAYPSLTEESFTHVLIARKTSTVLFHCKFDNRNTEVYWKDSRGKRIESRGRYLVFPNGSIAISGARGSDEGYYTCIGKSQFKKETAFTSNLKIAYIRPLSERLIFPPPDKDRFILVKNGEKLTIECRMPHSLPKAKLRLSRKSNNGKDYLDTEKTNYGVKISWKKAEDESVSGEYSCEAENDAGKRNYSFFVYVISKPQFKKSTPISQRVKEGENVTFRCILLRGLNPTTKLTWMKDDVEISTLDPRFKINSMRGELFIRDVQEYDAGSYSCKATTKSKFFQAVQSDNANLKVIIKLKFIPSFKDVYYLERSSYSSIYCKVKGSSIPTVTWKKSDGSQLPPHVFQKGDRLIFNKTRRSDSGNYSCISRLRNEKIEKTINITVVMKPKFSVLPINTTVKIGSPVMLHCVAVGDPVPKVHWVHEFNKDLMKNSRFVLKANGTLSISTTYMQDAGKYTCWAGNTGGLSNAVVYLHVSSEDENRRASKFSMMKTIIIAVCSAVAYLAVVIGLTVYCSLRLVKRRNASKSPEDKQDGAECTELIEKPNVHSIQTVGSIIKSDLNDSRSHASSHQSQSTATTSGYSKLLLRHNLQTIGLLGKSTFGEVLLAKSRTQDYSDTLVVVKSLLSSDEYHGQMFRSEIELFSRVSHDNVSKILAVSKDTEPHFFIMQYLEWGMLSAYLVALRRDSTSTTSPLTYGQQLAMCHQVSLGLEHIASLRMIHGDVAARNILLSPSLRLKVSSIALSRDAHAQDYYVIRDKPVPIRWMAPEGLTSTELSTKSDIFSFGVFVWEVFTLGLIPHSHLANEEVLQALEAGTLILDLLQHCPVSTVIERCTMHQPVLRPSFTEISSILADMTKDCH